MSSNEYADIKRIFEKKTLLVLHEVFTALWHCNIENILMKEKQLFLIQFSTTVALEDFECIQLKHISQV